MDIIRAQEQRNDLHEFFHNQVKYKFNAIFIGHIFSLANNICRRIHNCHVVTKGSSMNQMSRNSCIVQQQFWGPLLNL